MHIKPAIRQEIDKDLSSAGVIDFVQDNFGANMKKEIAIQLQKHALLALENLVTAVTVIHEGGSSTNEYEKLKRVLGKFIGQIDIRLLGEIYAQYPELDHLGEQNS